MTRLLKDLSRPDRHHPGGPTYREVGATRTPEALPEGYHHLRYSTVVGHGRAAFAAAGTAVTAWRMHRRSGAGLTADADRAGPGVRVEVSAGVGRFRIAVPCAVIWTAYEEDRTGFAYGTLAGHPECGEESFLVTLEPDGAVRFTVTAFSRPAVWYTRLAGPLVPFLQRAYARRLARTLRRLVRS
ncbi:hypothetical protein GCM10010497_61600 [Streptomyces cinereoruber]|uniref:DUF1990 domain-containing protein n=1 Tax=Streptomyces cinereoruber TaxID=67260 RepID=A0AAV4KR61_9ACTN|nr:MULTISPECIES: DUF1990 domain-containing protein [Streptomyces]AVH94272.1 DUF1990 domain-containing protein [Streptomyces sp. WAC00288]KYG51304.1 hypothetical protein AWI43_28025 [Streptomyces sp. WAC04657]MBB4158161.1 uncharacterized protein (UPF0548 family) [Streptomyces cinereoruber]MBY8819304.1 DUF1990 domain-containing protein [Streptomyces cinereoruber]NIH61686.1 uncharacterized protein (UPF0548 family) [Streptomyces cinereoruber]